MSWPYLNVLSEPKAIEEMCAQYLPSTLAEHSFLHLSVKNLSFWSKELFLDEKQPDSYTGMGLASQVACGQSMV